MGRGHVVVSMLTWMGNGQMAGKWDGGPHAKVYGKWTNSR